MSPLDVSVVLEHRFEQTPDGRVWTQTMFPYGFWCRYLDTFSAVKVVARVKPVRQVPREWLRADGDRVAFAPIPYYVGPWQYLSRAGEVRRAVRAAVGRDTAVILRVSSQLAACAEPLFRSGRPYGVEVVADPYDVFSQGSVKNVLRPVFRWWFPRQLRRQCRHAAAAAYVTEHALQRRYPAGPGAYVTHYSSIELPDSVIVSSPRRYTGERPLRLLFVGTLAQLYKGPDVLLKAFAQCVRNGVDLTLTVVGDGKHRAELEREASSLGISSRVTFTGQLSAGDAVVGELDRAHLFVLPSYQEGLPRAMIEAMARALPCLGSNVGGIPELLLPDEMVDPGDPAALARKIEEVAMDPARLTAMSARNLARAGTYRSQILRERRAGFYDHVSRATHAWLERSRENGS